uniref:Uncharacterized protein n=1 Tax=Acrobeloides nanus TaxID=290746 RepID=A0A914E2R2_9BILA
MSPVIWFIIIVGSAIGYYIYQKYFNSDTNEANLLGTITSLSANTPRGSETIIELDDEISCGSAHTPPMTTIVATEVKSLEKIGVKSPEQTPRRIFDSLIAHPPLMKSRKRK